jgi:hypothetical protein
MAMPAEDDPAWELLNIPFCPLTPTPKQAEFLLATEDEALYGGAAAGGKSLALLMAAAQYIDVPGYTALILRRSITDLMMPTGLIEHSHRWFSRHGRWDADRLTWTFPSGARITFGYLGNRQDHLRYQGFEFQCICFDELTQFDEHQYLYLNSRLRGPSDPTNPLSGVPWRMRSTSNPGGTGHEWVRRRFYIPWRDHQAGCGPQPDHGYYPASAADNPHVDPRYRDSLNRLDPVTRAQLLDSNWDIRLEGRLFQADWFTVTPDRLEGERVRRVRYWDLAATAPAKGRDPDYTAGVLLARSRDRSYVVEDVIRRQGTPHERIESGGPTHGESANTQSTSAIRPGLDP